MARIIHGQYGCHIYGEVIDIIRRQGRRRDSRNGLTYDLPDVTIALESPLYALPLNCGRNLNPRIAAAEALQLIGGFSEPDWLCRIAPQFDRYREDFEVWASCSSVSPRKTLRLFHGAYGNRVGLQLEHVIDKLTRDRNTRQAVVTLWNPAHDNEDGHLDYPCTVALGFRIDDDYLDMRVTMRSNDVWLGLPYDMFQFTQLQLSLCNALDLLPGRYTHTAWSMHLYASNLEESYNVTDNLGAPYSSLLDVHGVGSRDLVDHNGPFIHMRDRARDVALQRKLTDLTVSEAWYLDTLREFPIDVAPSAPRDGEGDRSEKPVQS